MNIFPVFHPPKLFYFLKFLIVTNFLCCNVVTLAILLITIYQLYFQISNCNLFVYVTLPYFFTYLL